MSKKAESPNGRVYIEYWPLSKLPPAERNPKLHDIEEIALSLRRFGVANIVAAVDERTGRMYVGHGRKEALLLYKERVEGGAEGWESPPLRVEAREGDWHVPVLRGVAFKDAAEAEAYLLADNQLTLRGGWDTSTQLESLKSLSTFEGTGFAEIDLDILKTMLGEVPNRPDFSGLIEKFQEAGAGKAEGDEKWFYVEYYGDDKTFSRLLKQLAPYMKGQSKHELEGKYFVQMVRAFLAAKKE